MKRDQRIEVRVSKDELYRYRLCAYECNMTLADWARNRLNENRNYSENARGLVEIAANMQTSLNKICAGIDIGVQLDNLQKGVNQLWQFSKK